jgi:hypothetical protein
MRFSLRPLVLALSLLPACSWLAGEIAEQKARQDALDSFVYPDPIAELWGKQLAPLWSKQGCTLPESPELKQTIECAEGDDKAWLRVTPVEGGHRVEVEHEVEHIDPEDPEKKIKERSRHYDLEWELLRNTHPDKAAEVEASAAKKGEKAKKAAKDLQDAFGE